MPSYHKTYRVAGKRKDFITSGGRPILSCTYCGEYVTYRWIDLTLRGNKVHSKRTLIHIDADGNRIYRSHAPTLKEQE